MNARDLWLPRLSPCPDRVAQRRPPARQIAALGEGVGFRHHETGQQNDRPIDGKAQPIEFVIRARRRRENDIARQRGEGDQHQRVFIAGPSRQEHQREQRHDSQQVIDAQRQPRQTQQRRDPAGIDARGIHPQGVRREDRFAGGRVADRRTRQPCRLLPERRIDDRLGAANQAHVVPHPHRERDGVVLDQALAVLPQKYVVAIHVAFRAEFTHKAPGIPMPLSEKRVDVVAQSSGIRIVILRVQVIFEHLAKQIDVRDHRDAAEPILRRVRADVCADRAIGQRPSERQSPPVLPHLLHPRRSQRQNEDEQRWQRDEERPNEDGGKRQRGKSGDGPRRHAMRHALEGEHQRHDRPIGQRLGEQRSLPIEHIEVDTHQRGDDRRRHAPRAQTPRQHIDFAGCQIH